MEVSGIKKEHWPAGEHKIELNGGKEMNTVEYFQVSWCPEAETQKFHDNYDESSHIFPQGFFEIILAMKPLIRIFVIIVDFHLIHSCISACPQVNHKKKTITVSFNWLGEVLGDDLAQCRAC